MAYYSIFPEKDSTIYSHPDRLEMNTGNDEILEIVKERGSTDNILYPTRIVIKFKNEEIKTVISDVIGSSTFNNISGTFQGYSQYKYGFTKATRDGVIYPSMDPSIFELKYPRTDINGRVTTY